MNLRDIFYTISKSSDKWDRYFDVYDRHLNQFQGKDITLVEVGVQKGGSIEMWAKFLGPNAKIYGIDIDPECLEHDYSAYPNVKILIGDQASAEFWSETLETIGNIDVFIDDGGHSMVQQIVTFQQVFPKINKEGVFICEDTHTSYFIGMNAGLKKSTTFIEYSKDLIDVINYNHIEGGAYLITDKFNLAKDISSIAFYDSMVVVEKQPLVEMKRVFSK